jgi:hypothetical protein
MDFSSIWDYLWFYIYKSCLFIKEELIGNPLTVLQNKILKE